MLYLVSVIVDAIDVVRLATTAIFKVTSSASYRPRNFLSVTRMSKTEVRVYDIGGARVSSPSERYVLSLVIDTEHIVEHVACARTR